jgi:hypothetical protein
MGFNRTVDFLIFLDGRYDETLMNCRELRLDSQKALLASGCDGGQHVTDLLSLGRAARNRAQGPRWCKQSQRRKCTKGSKRALGQAKVKATSRYLDRCRGSGRSWHWWGPSWHGWIVLGRSGGMWERGYRRFSSQGNRLGGEQYWPPLVQLEQP